MKVFTAGTFDTPHIGHAILLERAAKLGDQVFVALGTDEYIERYKGKRPIYTYQERKSLLEQLPCVTRVIQNDSDDLKPLLAAYEPDVLVIGSDWGDRYFDQIKVTPQWLCEHHIVMVYLPYTQEISSTQLKERLKQ